MTITFTLGWWLVPFLALTLFFLAGFVTEAIQAGDAFLAWLGFVLLMLLARFLP